MADDPAPILRDAVRLYLWIHNTFDRDPRPFAQHLCGLSLALVDDLLLALKGRERDLRLARSDDGLSCLRLHLRLAGERGELPPDALVHVLGLADLVGRQLGGWLAHLQRI